MIGWRDACESVAGPTDGDKIVTPMAELTDQQTFDLAQRHHHAGRLSEAEQLYRRILSQQPNHVGAMYLLGLVANQTGQADTAIDLISRAIALKASLPGAYYNLGIALQNNGRLAEAIGAYRQAIARNPADAQAHGNLGAALKDSGELEEAINVYRQGLAINPDSAEIFSNLGNALNEAGRRNEAIAAYGRAIALKPELAQVHYNLGLVLQDVGQVDQAIAAYRRAIALNPDWPQAHNDLALALLLRGDFQTGWKEHEWRLKLPGIQAHKSNFQPLFTGQEIAGQTILLHAEQGLGDTIQFLRYVPLLASRGAKIILEVQCGLERIAESVAGVHRILKRGEPLPPFDFQGPLMSLPLALKTTLESIPASIPYLFPDPELVESWRDKVSKPPAGLRTALAWAGNPLHKKDSSRSIPFSVLSPLSTVSGVQFYSLQKGEAARRAANPPSELSFIDLTNELGDFADTAALIAQMDLVISVDTAVVHLAGAMGKPVWVMLPFAPDWRWMLNREDSPWYPTMRLFRQKRIGDWEDVVRRVGEALGERVIQAGESKFQ